MSAILMRFFNLIWTLFINPSASRMTLWSQGVNTWIKTDSAMRTNSVWAQQHVCQCSLEKLFNHSHTIHEQICFVKMHMARYLLELTENPAPTEQESFIGCPYVHAWFKTDFFKKLTIFILLVSESFKQARGCNVENIEILSWFIFNRRVDSRETLCWVWPGEIQYIFQQESECHFYWSLGLVTIKWGTLCDGHHKASLSLLVYLTSPSLLARNTETKGHQLSSY